jgi:hypothetical protein
MLYEAKFGTEADTKRLDRMFYCYDINKFKVSVTVTQYIYAYIPTRL